MAARTQAAEMQRLRAYLSKLSPGQVTDDSEAFGELVGLIEVAWAQFEGARQTSMAPHKAGRTDEIVWEPPLLYIKVERHGGIALGGTRAEIQQWVLNVENCTASADLIGHRQLMPMAPRWDAVRAAQELRDPILSGADHPALRWTKGTRSEVTVILKNVVPDSYKQTAAGRRKRLRTALEAELSAHGWKPVPDKPGAVFRL